MKIHEAIRLRNVYGGETTLNDLVSLIQGNRIHRCPKCGGSGTTIKRVNRAQYWECCDDYKEIEVTCDLCNGEGYTEKIYKPKMVQDGWKCEQQAKKSTMNVPNAETSLNANCSARGME